MKHTERLKEHKKLIEYEAGKYSKFLPYDVLLAEAYKIGRKASEGFDETKGTKFSTHLTNQLKKLSRISNTYGSNVRLPENKQFKLQKINEASKELGEQLGREPSVLELSEFTKIPITQVKNILQNKVGEVNLSSAAYTPVFVNNTNDDWIHFVYHDLSDIDRVIFEHKTGFGGKKIMNNDEIAKLVHLSANTVSNRVKMISNKMQEHWQDE
jgi:DNA-directed RNA polymerase specialized sigma subunit